MQCSGWPPPAIAAIMLRNARFRGSIRQRSVLPMYRSIGTMPSEAPAISASRSDRVAPSMVGDDRAEPETARPINSEPPLARDLRTRSALFDGLTADQLTELRSFCRERQFASG